MASPLAGSGWQVWCGRSCIPRATQASPLPAIRGSGCGCNCADVLGVDEAPHLLAGWAAVDQVTPVAEATQVEGPYVHHGLEPLKLVVGQLDVLAVRAHGQIDPVRVAPGAPHQPGKVRQARAAPGRLPVDRYRPVLAQDHVVRSVEEVAVQQCLWQTLPSSDGRVVERRHCILGREPLRRVVVPL